MSYFVSNLNLNMLIAFDAVCRFKNMTRAAEDISISQPAVSRYMKELRQITGQEFFRKTADGVEITEIGLEFWRKAVIILDNAEYFTRYSEHDFDPLEQAHEFRLAVPLNNTSYFVEELILHSRKHFPLVNINLLNMDMYQAIEQLESRKIGAYIGYEPEMLPPYIDGQEIADIDFTVICSKNSPLYEQDTLSKKEFVETPHVKVNSEVGESTMDRSLKQAGILQDSLTSVPDMASMLVLLRNTEMLFIAQSDHAALISKQYDDIKILKPKGFALPKTKLHMLWNKSNTPYRPHIWLREYVKKRIG